MFLTQRGMKYESILHHGAEMFITAMNQYIEERRKVNILFKKIIKAKVKFEHL